MIKHDNVSTQSVSWLKSNSSSLERHTKAIKHLFYPENTEELIELTTRFYKENKRFDLIGWSSNTLFLPTYRVDNLICTKKLRGTKDTANDIVCDCGVSVSELAKGCVQKGYKGFYGLVDLPGTIGAAVYGNCGCFGCSVMDLIDHITFLNSGGKLINLTKEDLHPTYRDTSLKRKEINGVIIQVVLKKEKGDPIEETAEAENVKAERRRTQPNGVNNLGSTFVLGKELSKKGHRYYWIVGNLRKWLRIKDEKTLSSIALTLMGGHKFTPYLFDLGRWMFYDTKSYDLLFEYERFIKDLFPKTHLEIEVRK